MWMCMSTSAAPTKTHLASKSQTNLQKSHDDDAQTTKKNEKQQKAQKHIVKAMYKDKITTKLASASNG